MSSHTNGDWEFKYLISYNDKSEEPFITQGWTMDYWDVTFKGEPYDGELPDNIYQESLDELSDILESDEGESRYEDKIAATEYYNNRGY